MFRNLAENITFILIKKRVLNIEDRDIYLYAMEAICLNMFILISILIISILGRNLFHFAGFICFFIPLRVLVGGYHAKNSENCYLLTVAGYTVSLVIVEYYPFLYRNKIALGLLILSLLAILVWSPAKNQNHPLSDSQYKRNMRIAYGVVVLDSVLLLIFIKYEIAIVASEVIFLIYVSSVLVVGKVLNKIEMGRN